MTQLTDMTRAELIALCERLQNALLERTEDLEMLRQENRQLADCVVACFKMFMNGRETPDYRIKGHGITGLRDGIFNNSQEFKKAQAALDKIESVE